MRPGTRLLRPISHRVHTTTPNDLTPGGATHNPEPEGEPRLIERSPYEQAEESPVTRGGGESLDVPQPCGDTHDLDHLLGGTHSHIDALHAGGRGNGSPECPDCVSTTPPTETFLPPRRHDRPCPRPSASLPARRPMCLCGQARPEAPCGTAAASRVTKVRPTGYRSGLPSSGTRPSPLPRPDDGCS